MADWQARLTLEEALHLVDLAELAARAPNLENLAATLLPDLATMTGAMAAVLFLEDPRLLAPLFFQGGLPPKAASPLEGHLAAEFRRWQQVDRRAPRSVSFSSLPGSRLHLFPLCSPGVYHGLLGLLSADPGGLSAASCLQRFLPLLTQNVAHLLDREEYEKKIAHLNTYLTISSMIAQALDLRDVLEAVLYFSMEAVAAEAASVLLLDYEKKNFKFYSVEGPAKPVLLTATFPADQGLAGAILTSQQSEVINDVQHDPRFYGKIDAESGFSTHSMIVIPLTAGEEKVGVLEVLNKVGDRPFTEEERLLLQSIADEIAFAIRNAKLFEVVVKSYCKQRQGLNTCKGCKRPLGSWTPCVKYREEAGLLE
jgi:GAF domain-containing protein